MKFKITLILLLLTPYLNAEVDFPVDQYEKFSDIEGYIKQFHVQPKWNGSSSSFHYFNHQNSNIQFFDIVNFKPRTYLSNSELEKLKGLISFRDSSHQLYKIITFRDPRTIEIKYLKKEFTIQVPELKIISQRKIEIESPRLISKKTNLSPFPKYEVRSPDSSFFVTIESGKLAIRKAGTDLVSAIQLPKGFKNRIIDWNMYSIKWLAGSNYFVITNSDYTHAPTYDLTESFMDSLPRIISGIPYITPKDDFYPKDLFIVDAQNNTARRIESGESGEKYYEIQSNQSDSSIIFSTVDRLYRQRSYFLFDLEKPVHYIFSDISATYLMDNPIGGRSGLLKIYKNQDYLHFISERSGTAQIYEVKIPSGNTRRVTNSPYVIDDILGFDKKSATIYYSALGEDRNPYHVHIYRSKKGNEKRLTKLGYTYHKPMTYRAYNGPGDYDSSYLSPDFKYLISNYSNLENPSQSKVLNLETNSERYLGKSDPGDLLKLGWSPPKEIQAKALDNKTDLYGIMYLPTNFDPAKKYPLVNFIYGGPQYKQTSWSFVDSKKHFAYKLAGLGFIVVQLDSRGTPGRGKIFQDYNYQKFGQVEVYEHKYFIEQQVEKYDFIDSEKIAVVGSSFGGFQALHFITREPNFFKIAVANAAVADLRDVHSVSVMMYMGDPKKFDKAYEGSSIFNQIGSLNPNSKLLILHGSQDVNAPLFGMMKLVERMTADNIHFDLFIDPLTAHSRRDYTWEKIARYLYEHLY
ncbi:MAG: prolyl oligopeptidase family serine peptidase [Bdellovibrionales bacterium]